MPITGDYEPSPSAWVREQVEEYEGSGGTRATTLRETGLPVIVVTMLGHRSGKVRKVPLMRVESGGEYALVASKGGAPQHPLWYANLLAATEITIQDGPEVRDHTLRLVEGDERAVWWQRAVAAFPNYADYQAKTEREIPVFVATPA
jgi:deazaflavin-dependent oxidoreductase (nitroreductase family)